jgi:hypothetical protein
MYSIFKNKRLEVPMRIDTTMYADAPIQMALPVFQPLRLWNPRQDSRGKRCVLKSAVPLSTKGFSMKGGFVSMPGGERKLIIAGKISRG